MGETLVDFLKEQPGYLVEGKYIKRPDKSIAAEYKSGKWVTAPTQHEMVLFNIYCGRGIPSLFAKKDLTNPGSK